MHQQNQKTTINLAFLASFLVGGLAVILVSMTYDALIPTRLSILLRTSLIAIFFVSSHFLRMRPNALSYRRLLQALLAATVGLFASWYASPVVQGWLGYSTATPGGIAAAKLVSSVIIVGCILGVTRCYGFELSDLYLSKGRLGWTLGIGVAGFLGMVLLAISHPENREVPFAQIMPLIPAIVVFIFANAFMEELLFRGLFLKQLTSQSNTLLANLATATVFTAGHLSVTYTPDLIFFLCILFVLALAWGSLMQRSESIIGSTLFHAGADVIIVLGVFHSMGVRLDS